jgi:hypothetical protein
MLLLCQWLADGTQQRAFVGKCDAVSEVKVTNGASRAHHSVSVEHSITVWYHTVTLVNLYIRTKSAGSNLHDGRIDQQQILSHNPVSSQRV